MNRQSGDPDAPDPLAEADPLASSPDSLDAQAAWLWHDLALPQGVAPLSPSPDLQTRIDALVLLVLRSGHSHSAGELSRICLGLSETAPHILSRAFWQLAAGLFETLALQALSLDEALKRLVSQVLRQYSLYQVDPQGREVSELLCHDLLDVCLQVPMPSSAVLLPVIRQAYAGQPLPAVNLNWPDASPETDLSMPELAPAVNDAKVASMEASQDVSLGSVPSELAPMVLTQALQWSRELADELAAWAPKPSRPLAPTVTVLAQVLTELLKTAHLDQLAEVAAALHAALLRAQRQISVLPHQAQVLVQAAQVQHAQMQALSAGQLPAVDADQLDALNSWPSALQIQEQATEENQGLATENVSAPTPLPEIHLDVNLTAEPPAEAEPEAEQAAEQAEEQIQEEKAEPEHKPVDEPQAVLEPEPPAAPLPKVKRPVLDAPDAPRLLYVQSIAARWLKALQPQGLAAELVLHEPSVALVRSDLQQLAALLDLLLPALRLALKAEAPVLQITLDPAHDHLTLELAWMQQVGRMPLDDLEMSQPWQMLLGQTRARLDPVGESAWRLTLPVQHLLCKVQVLRAGDLKLATPARTNEAPAWFFGRNPPAAVAEVLGEQEVILQAPSPVMRRVHGVVGVMPKASGMPVLVYRTDLLRPQADYVFLTTP